MEIDGVAILRRFQRAADEIMVLAQQPLDSSKPEFSFGESYQILSHLMGGRLREYLQSGQEGCLRQRVLISEEGSFGPEDVFSLAYSGCCQRGVYCSLLTSYNVLEAGNNVPYRDRLPVQRRLQIIRPLDNFGAYYHFFGAALCTFLFGEDIGWWAYHTRLVLCHISASFSPPGEGFLDLFEFQIDQLGYEMGTSLHRRFFPDARRDRSDFNSYMGEAMLTFPR